MCRCGNGDAGPGALYYARERKEPLRIRAFYVRLTGARRGPQHYAAPETLMLVYLPRINGVALEVNGARVRADTPAFVTLHRVRAAESGGDLVYGSTDRVRAGEGVRFEAHIGEERAVKGSFRRREGGGWRMECGFAAAAVCGVAEAEVCVAGEGNLLMREKVKVAATRRRHGRFCSGLEEIPEELGEGEGCCDCCDDEWEVLETSEGSDPEEEEEEEEECGEKSWKKEGEEEEEAEESTLEGVRWAVDLGIWAVCLGVGLLVSKASYKRRRSGSLLSF